MAEFGLVVVFGIIILAIAFVLAPLKLFSIDRTLREIRDELRAARELDAARSVSAGAPRPIGGA